MYLSTDIKEYFDVEDDKNCFIKKCEFKTPDCKSALGSDLLAVEQAPGFKLTYKIDKQEGHFLNFCLECSNDFKKLSIPGFKITQTKMCE